MITGEYQWGLGVYVGLPILALLVAVCVAVAVAAGRLHRKDTNHEFTEEFRWIRNGFAVAAPVVLVLGALCWYPFTPAREFHAWNKVAGPVASISNRFLGDGNGSMSQRIVVRFAGSNGLYGCDDSRCTSLKAGDRVALLCKREWQFRGQSGWECKWDGELP